MTWPIRGRARWVAAGLALALVAAAAFWLGPRPPEEFDVEYGRVGGRSLRLDIYRPVSAKGPRPGVLLIHGGGWVQGDKADQRELARGLARAGYVAVAVGYRLAKDDGSRHPAQVDDVRRAARWARAHAGYLGIDPARLGAVGGSAGGHLAAMLGTTDVDRGDDPALDGHPSRVACVVDCCGPTDFTDEASPPLGPGSLWLAGNLLGKAREHAPEARRDASPAAHVDARSAPTLIVHGTADDVVPIDQSRRLRDALRAAGVEVRLVELEGQGHIVQGEAAEVMLREIMAFLGHHLRP